MVSPAGNGHIDFSKAALQQITDKPENQKFLNLFKLGAVVRTSQEVKNMATKALVIGAVIGCIGLLALATCGASGMDMNTDLMHTVMGVSGGAVVLGMVGGVAFMFKASKPLEEGQAKGLYANYKLNKLTPPDPDPVYTGL